MGKDAAQGIQRAGGWGPVFLDGGSGYDLGAALGAPRAPAPTRGRAPCRGARRGALPRMSAGTCGAMRRARAALQRETSHALACPSGFVCSMTCLVAKRVCADLGVPNRAARARRAARAGGGGARVRQARPEHRAGRRAVRALPGRGRGRPAGVRARGAGYAACSLPARARRTRCK